MKRMKSALLRILFRTAIDQIKARLAKLSDAELKEISAKINRKIDIPGINEETEGKVIYRTLCSVSDVLEELVKLIPEL